MKALFDFWMVSATGLFVFAAVDSMKFKAALLADELLGVIAAAAICVIVFELLLRRNINIFSFVALSLFIPALQLSLYLARFRSLSYVFDLIQSRLGSEDMTVGMFIIWPMAFSILYSVLTLTIRWIASAVGQPRPQ